MTNDDLVASIEAERDHWIERAASRGAEIERLREALREVREFLDEGDDNSALLAIKSALSGKGET